MVKIIYSNSWRIKPFTHGRPFVKLKDYNKLKKEYDDLIKSLYNIKKKEEVVNSDIQA